MKKFNLKLLTPLLLTFVLQGCMPDSLTKFKKDEPKKATSSSSSTSAPVVDSSGTAVPFDPPTFFYFGDGPDTKFSFAVNGTAAAPAKVDGSLADASNNRAFYVGCTLVTSGNSQTTALPTGLKLDPISCNLTGTPSINKSVTTAFCSDPAYTDQTSCESAPLMWDSSTSKCSINDFQFNTQAKCEAAFNQWYEEGAQVPYRVKLTYKNSSGTNYDIYTTIRIGTYTPLSALAYTQADKVSIGVTTANGFDFMTIAPLKTSTSTLGAYPAKSVISFINGYQGAANYIDNGTTKIIGIKRFNKFTLNSAATFTAGGFITTSTGKIGKIFRKDTNNTNIIYVENISPGEKYFTVGDQLDNAYPYVAAENVGATTTKVAITAIDETNQISLTQTQLDNDSKYFSTRMNMIGLANAYMVNSPEDIKPIKPIVAIPANNATTFTITPKLPDGLDFDDTTGIISGKFLETLDTTTFTITATNPLGSVTTTVRLVANEAPQDLNYTTKQILTVSDTAFFNEGEELFQQITPPLATAPRGRILKILNNYQIAVSFYDSPFLQGASLDSGSQYFAEKTFIIPDNACVKTDYDNQADCESNGYTWSTGEIFYNLALTINNTGTYNTGSCPDGVSLNETDCAAAGYVWGPTYVTSAGGAKGVVVGIFKAANDILFVEYLTQSALSVTTAKTFNQGDTLNTGDLVTLVDNDNMTLTLTAPAQFVAGSDITSNNGAGAYIYKNSGSNIYVGDITVAKGFCDLPIYALSGPCSSNGGNWADGRLFKNGDTIYSDETTTGTAPTFTNTTITNITHDNLLVLERGQKVLLHSTLSSGSGVFSISPPLPGGLTLNTRNGDITGTPTTISARKDYIVTATNFVGQSTFVFSMEVRDYFKITDNSGASSYILHKSGNTQINRQCRVSASDIQSNTVKRAVDIRCYLDAEEEDIYYKGLKITASAGPGICQYVSYVPYYFNQYAPAQSLILTSKYQVKTAVISGCASSGVAPTAATACEGDYESIGGPNCDEGYIEYTTQVWDDNAGPSTCSVNNALTQTVKVQCGGKRTNCLQGPVRDILSDTAIAGGTRGLNYPAVSGFQKTWEHATPETKGNYTNLRIANGTVNNKCSGTLEDTKLFADGIKAESSLESPLGSQNPFYVFTCMDAAFESKARIRLIVRDWDRSFKIKDGIDMQNPLADKTYMNTGTDKDPIFDVEYNQIEDWDDGVTADYNSCGAVDAVGDNFCTGAWPANATQCAYTGGIWDNYCTVKYQYTNAACIAPAVAGQWKANPGCNYYNKYQCELHGGTWNGKDQYGFPGLFL